MFMKIVGEIFLQLIFLSCGRNMLRKVESLVVMLYYASIAYLSPPNSGGLTMILYIYLTDTYNNKFVYNYGPTCPSIYNLRQSLAIGDCTT